MTIINRFGRLLAICSFSISIVNAQEIQTFNQKLSAYNQTSLSHVTDADSWSFGFGTGVSAGLKNNENILFRGNSVATKMFGRYYFGNIGLAATTGIAAGSISGGAVNKFIVDRKLPQEQLQVTKTNPSNSYLLIGPSFRFGGKVYVNAELQGGLFFNNAGAVNILQQGSTRSFYSFDNGNKSLFPGFSGSISINYPLSPSTHFFINADYLQSKSSIRLLDIKNGIDVATQVNRDVKMMVAGIGVIKSFGGRHTSPGGMATGRRRVGRVKYQNKSITEDPSNGESTMATSQRPGNNSNVSGPANGRIMNNENCGPVTFTNTSPDGSTTGMTFACPSDAAQYNQRIGTNGATAKQTQGSTFGEKVATGLQSSGGTGMISGAVYWGNGNQPGITTNEMAAIGSGSNSSGGAASAAYAATGRKLRTPPVEEAVVANIYVRDPASGLPTGKRQHSLVFSEGNNNSCNDCGITVKLLAHEAAHTVQQAAGQRMSPLYQGSTAEGNNPLYENKSNTATSPLYESNSKAGDNPLYGQRINSDSRKLCGTTGHFLVILSDPNSGKQIAKTTTDFCGNFWFAHVPAGNYAVQIRGNAIVQKVYEVAINKEGKRDLAGEMLVGNTQLMVTLNTGEDESGDGESKVIVRGWDPVKKETITDKSGQTTQPLGRVAGEPIGGIVVKGGRNPGGQMKMVQTNENGTFEFTGLKKGNYIITAEIPFAVDEATIVTVKGDAKDRVQDYNSSKSK